MMKIVQDSTTSYNEDVWRLLDTYFSHNHEHQLVKHLIDSYNDFVLKRIEQIIEGFNPIEISHNFDPILGAYRHELTIEITNPILTKPLIHEKDGSVKLMTPNDARTRGFTYAAPLLVDVVFVTKTLIDNPPGGRANNEYIIERKSFSGVSLGKLPIMVRSRYCMLGSINHNLDINAANECRYDVGGYFVVNGNEKVVISHDRIAENKTYVFVNTKVSPFSHIADIRSMSDTRYGMPKTTSLKYSGKPNQLGRFIRVTVQHIKIDIPLFVLFRALGIVSDKAILAHCHVSAEDLAGSIIDGNHIYSREAALEYIARNLQVPSYASQIELTTKSKIAALENVLKKDLLPHVGLDLAKKGMYLGYMVHKLISSVSGKTPFDDRDSYINKRVDTPGVLLASLFRQNFSKVVKDMKNMLHKEINCGNWKPSGKVINIMNKVNIRKIIRSSIIETGLKYGLSTGNWGIKTPKTKQGVAQVLNRMTNSATLSHLRRISTPIEKSGKLVQPRKLHGTQWGIVCPSETPEGASVGLVKNLALMTGITLASSAELVRTVVIDFKGVTLPSVEANMATKIIINGDIFAETLQPLEMYKKLKHMKRSGIIHVYTSVAWHVIGLRIIISTEAGRCVRPLFVVPMQSIRGKSWNTCMIDGTIEYLDVEESSIAMIAMRHEDLAKNADIRYTHVEIDPSLILGVLAGSIPFSDHNQAPRNTYQSAMGKQAIGMYSTRYQDRRYDTMSHVLNYPQRPLVYTRIGRLTKIDDMPCGINVIVAIATYTGFNQEDSIIMNQSSVDRGMFNSTFYRTYKEQNNKNHSSGEEEFFCRPNAANIKGMKPYNYSKLGEDGFVPANTFVDTGDIIIGKCMGARDSSVVLKGSERGFIDRNACNDAHFINTNGDGYTFAKVRIRGHREPTIGDKFCMPMDHEVLTASGWVDIEDVTTQHFVAQLEDDGVSINYVHPTATMSFANSDALCEVVSEQGIKLYTCTPEHKLYLRHGEWFLGNREWKLVAALDTFSMAAFDSMIGASGGLHNGILPEVCGVGWLDEHPVLRMFVIAAFIVGGNLDFRKKTGRIHMKNFEVNDILFSTDKFEITDSVATFDDPALFDMFKKIMDTPGLPACMLTEHDPRICRRVITDVFFGTSETLVASTCLVDSIQQLALHSFSLAISIERIDERTSRATLLKTDVISTHCLVKQSKINASRVYCIEVPSHVFFVRSKSHRVGAQHVGVWTGNSSRHGQKGTVGILYRQEDMPFTADGIVPDIIINPHAIPSRMTVAQLMECIMGKACTSIGTFGNATPFMSLKVTDLTKLLQEHGMEAHGNELMYNSRTGEQLKTSVFMGPTFYQRLKHMVDDKIHSRAASGPVVMMTRQPAEGRARDGGLRLGEMEIECNWAHGTMQFLKERFMECSDNYRVHICRKCGMMATANPERNIYSCKACKNINSFAEIRIPYACKLFFQEVQTMNIGLRFMLDKSSSG